MKIEFCGAAREVTGSKHVITTKNGKKILLDCGLYQGKGIETEDMNRNLGFDPESINYMVLSHAHIDHSGCIPYLVKKGFKGKILCTHSTRDLCAIMLIDSGNIQEHDTHTNNKKRALQNLPPLEPIYTAADAEKCMKNFISISYDSDFEIDKNIKVCFTDVGHILGSGAVNIEIKEGRKTHKICYTGDIGRPHNKILKDPQPFTSADILITESTYGDRLHDEIKNAENQLLEVVFKTCVEKKGKLIIPSFSIGRTQEIVYALKRLHHAKKLPKIDVFVDSPLSTNATNIMRLHPECFNDDILKYMQTEKDPFGFNNLYYVQSEEESKRLNSMNDPCIIISASGMMEAGRIKHHLANEISKQKNTILVIGYCAPLTLGAKIVRGDKNVSIFGTMHEVKADVKVLESFSAHGDYNEMISFLEKYQDKKKLKKLFLVHGEYQTQINYKKKLEENGFSNIEIPEINQTYEF